MNYSVFPWWQKHGPDSSGPALKWLVDYPHWLGLAENGLFYLKGAKKAFAAASANPAAPLEERLICCVLPSGGGPIVGKSASGLVYRAEGFNIPPFRLNLTHKKWLAVNPAEWGRAEWGGGRLNPPRTRAP
ncbi:MAG: hypothetical protein LBD18_02030 [Treponema sp.]|nr:hypothetical protein [Treponema sp.]